MTVRELVVIDPEDREQIERLMALYVNEAVNRGAMCEQFSGQLVKRSDAFIAALREFANPTPPKPDEPTGLGAVVDDASGHIWVRAEMVVQNRWVNSTSGSLAGWSNIPEPRVLHPGHGGDQ